MSRSTGPAILGIPSCREPLLVEVNCEVRETLNQPNSKTYITSKSDLIDASPDQFEGICIFRGEFHITIDKSVPPVVHSPRRCAIHLKDSVKTEHNKMEELAVITEVSAPTDWVVYSRKSDNKLRMCLDPKDLNKVITILTTKRPLWMRSLTSSPDQEYSPNLMPATDIGLCPWMKHPQLLDDIQKPIWTISVRTSPIRTEPYVSRTNGPHSGVLHRNHGYRR